MAYGKITLFANASYGYLALANRQLSSTDIDTINNLTISPQWNTLDGDPFVILAKFEDTLRSSYVSGLTEEITGWSIYRREITKTESTLVAKVDRKVISIIDPMVANGKQYRYYVFPESENMIGLSMISNDVRPSSNWSYTLSNITERADGIYIATYPWKFSFNLTSGVTTQNLSISILETLQKFDKISKGKRNYLTMSITCLLGDIDSETGRFDSDIDKLNAWREFVANSGYCVWKDRLGDIRIVSISANPTTQTLDDIGQAVYEINLSVQEILGLEDLTGGVITEESEKENKDFKFIFIQNIASNIWNCSHGLNKYPEVSVVDFNGNEIGCDIEYIDKTTCVLSFSSSIVGIAYFD